MKTEAEGGFFTEEIMSTKKKKAAKAIGLTVVVLILLPLLLPCFLLILLYTPVDYLRFKASAYHKLTGHKYRWIITTADTYRIHRIITNECLDIKYFEDDPEDGTTGFFVAGDTLLAFGISRGSLLYDEESGALIAFCRDGWSRLDSFLEGELARFNEKHGASLRRAVALYSRVGFEKNDRLSDGEREALVKAAESSDLLRLYDGKRALYEALISINEEMKAAESKENAEAR